MSSIIERNLPEQVGKIIRNSRNYKDMSLQQLSKKTGVSAAYIMRLEKGERSCPSVLILTKIADELGLDVTNLLSLKKNTYQTELTNLIMSDSFLIGGRDMRPEERDLLLEFIRSLESAAWTNKNKAVFVVEMLQKINRIKDDNTACLC